MPLALGYEIEASRLPRLCAQLSLVFQVKATADGSINNETTVRFKIAIGNVPIEIDSAHVSAPLPYSLGFEKQ